MNQTKANNAPFETSELPRIIASIGEIKDPKGKNNSAITVGRISIRRRSKPGEHCPYETLMYLNINPKRTGLSIDAYAADLRKHFQGPDAGKEARIFLNHISDEQMYALTGAECPVNLKGIESVKCITSGIEIPTWEMWPIGHIERRVNGKTIEWYFVPSRNALEMLKEAKEDSFGKYRGQIINLKLHTMREIIAEGKDWKLTRLTRDGNLELQVQRAHKWNRLLRGDIKVFHEFSKLMQSQVSCELRGAHGENKEIDGIPKEQLGCLPVIEIDGDQYGVTIQRTSGCTTRELTAYIRLSAQEKQHLQLAIDQQCVGIMALALSGQKPLASLANGY